MNKLIYIALVIFIVSCGDNNSSSTETKSNKEKMVGLWYSNSIPLTKATVLFKENGTEYDIIDKSAIFTLHLQGMLTWNVTDDGERLIETIDSNSTLRSYLLQNGAPTEITTKIIEVSDKYLILSLNGKEITYIKLDDSMINNFLNAFNSNSNTWDINKK